MSSEIDALRQRIAELERRNRELEELVNVDELTGLINRRAFDARLTQEVQRSIRHSAPLSLLFVDTDHFKIINDQHGHAAGDAALRCVAQLLSSTLRQTDCAARWGGEEFAVILPDTGLEGAFEAAERVRTAIERTASDYRVTVSIGIAGLSPEITTPAQLIQRADSALYHAKARGGNCVHTACDS